MAIMVQPLAALDQRNVRPTGSTSLHQQLESLDGQSDR